SFGCEADDRATMWAFDERLGARLRPVFSSDFTHFDVPDFEEVMPEAFEMLERGFMSAQDFREFTFTNAARLHTRNNPGFFAGTEVERAVAEELRLLYKQVLDPVPMHVAAGAGRDDQAS